MQNGEEPAFEEIYTRYWKQLFALAAHKLGNLAEAEEIVQDIFLDLWQRREQLSIVSGLPVYLAVAVKYKVLNVLARKHVRMKYEESLSLHPDGADRSTENWLQFEQLKEQLLKETAKLPEKCRLVFRLSREEGYTHKEIAVEMGISEKTVESHLSKALRTLRGNLGHLFLFLIC